MSLWFGMLPNFCKQSSSEGRQSVTAHWGSGDGFYKRRAGAPHMSRAGTRTHLWHVGWGGIRHLPAVAPAALLAALHSPRERSLEGRERAFSVFLAPERPEKTPHRGCTKVITTGVRDIAILSAGRRAGRRAGRGETLADDRYKFTTVERPLNMLGVSPWTYSYRKPDCSYLLPLCLPARRCPSFSLEMEWRAALLRLDGDANDEDGLDAARAQLDGMGLPEIVTAVDMLLDWAQDDLPQPRAVSATLSPSTVPAQPSAAQCSAAQHSAAHHTAAFGVHDPSAASAAGSSRTSASCMDALCCRMCRA